jgi:hypothetical protein
MFIVHRNSLYNNTMPLLLDLLAGCLGVEARSVTNFMNVLRAAFMCAGDNFINFL